MKTKYVGENKTLRKSPDDLKALIFDIMKSLGCLETISKEVAEHLVNSSLSGVDSHGIWRILQYAEYYQNGYLKKNVLPEIRKGKKNSAIIDGLGGIGIPAMNVALQHSIKETKKTIHQSLQYRNSRWQKWSSCYRFCDFNGRRWFGVLCQETGA